MDIVGKLGDPVADVAALKPLVDHIIDRLRDEVFSQLAGQIAAQLKGLVVKIEVS